MYTCLTRLVSPLESVLPTPTLFKVRVIAAGAGVMGLLDPGVGLQDPGVMRLLELGTWGSLIGGHGAAESGGGGLLQPGVGLHSPGVMGLLEAGDRRLFDQGGMEVLPAGGGGAAGSRGRGTLSPGTLFS